MWFRNDEVERKAVAILKVLKESPEALGAGAIASRLGQSGIDMAEGTVRYHLRLMDERGFTRLLANHDGRVLTDTGAEELKCALVEDKIAFAISRIDQLAFRTSFDTTARKGLVPVDVSVFSRDAIGQAVSAMRPVFRAGMGVSNQVAIAAGNEVIGEVGVAEGQIGLGTISNVAINGALLKAGIPVTSRFCGILQVTNGRPLRFVELIEYSGCSLEPSQVFLRARMTAVGEAVKTGQGRILAVYREIPAICREPAQHLLDKLKEAGIGGLLASGRGGESLCGIRVAPDQVGFVLANGLNPVAAAAESGIEVEDGPTATAIDYAHLIDICAPAPGGDPRIGFPRPEGGLFAVPDQV